MPVAKYTDIADQLKREILAGRYEGGKPFPSGGQLAKRFSVSRPTINRVMLDLRLGGFLKTRSGCAPRLTRFAQNATGTLGVIHPGFQYGDVLSHICRSLARYGEQLGWDIVLIEMKEREAEKRLQELVGAVRQFSDERVAGLFLQPFEYLVRNDAAANAFWHELSSFKTPIVLLDYDPLPAESRQRYDLVCMDNFSAGLALGRALIGRGIKKISFFMKEGSPPSVLDRMRGVAGSVIESSGVWNGIDNILSCGIGEVRAVSRFMKTKSPEAIICGNDITAVQLHETIVRAGLAGTVKLAGFDDQAEAAGLNITSVVQPVEEIARVALKTMIGRLQDPTMPICKVQMRHRGIVR